MKDPGRTAASFAEALEKRFGERLHSVLLFGSVARGEAVPGVSDINVLILLDRIDADALKAAGPLARRWASAGNTAPLLMAEGEWRRAADAFAVELADMQDAHEVLRGRDPLRELEVDGMALRLQAERELRGKLLQLREGMLLAADDEARIGRLLLVALPSFVTYMRAALRLVGRKVPLHSPEVIEDAGQLLGLDPAPLVDLWRARADRKPVRTGVDSPLVHAYYGMAEATAAFVDDLSDTRS